VLSETCEEDLWELWEDVEGVWLGSKRSSASFRLEVFSWDSDSESWLCEHRDTQRDIQYISIYI